MRIVTASDVEVTPEDELTARREAAVTATPRAPRAATARGRAESLCDTGTFTELEPFRRSRSHSSPVDGDGVVTGWGLISGRPVAIVAHDFGFAGGSIGAAFASKVTRLQRMAIDRRMPIVYLNDSGGARIGEGIEALHGCGEIMALNVAAGRLVPQVSAIFGPCAGAAAYSPALTDWTIMTRGAGMFLTGPDVVRSAIGENVGAEELGGCDVHLRESGVAHLAATDEAHALELIRTLIGWIPSSAGAPLPMRPSAPPPADKAAALAEVVPRNPRAAFDMREVVYGIVDAGNFLQVMPDHAPSLLTGFARIDGIPAGIVASQPNRRGGILDASSAAKGARFVSFCGRFGIPIVSFVDVPGFMPGAAEERRAVITHGAALVRAYVEADVPKVTVVVRKAYGGAYIALGSRSLGAHMTWAWPASEIAVMGPEAAVRLLHRKELAAAGDPGALQARLTTVYRDRVTSPYTAAELGIVDDVILPTETRARLVSALRLLTL